MVLFKTTLWSRSERSRRMQPRILSNLLSILGTLAVLLALATAGTAEARDYAQLGFKRIPRTPFMACSTTVPLRAMSTAVST